MSYLDRLMNDISSTPQVMSLINPDGKFQTFRMDQLKECLREVEWTKKGVEKYAFKNQYNRNRTDDQILDAMEKNGRFDADDGLIFARQLEQLDPRRFEVIRKPLEVWKRLMPVQTFQPGKEYITYRVRDYKGKAKLSTVANVNDTNVVSVNAEEARNYVYPWTAAYQYTASELRKAAVSGISLQQDNVMAVEIAYQEQIQETMLLGNSKINLEGLFNHTGVTSTEVPAGATATDRTWTSSTTKTPAEIVADITGMTAEIFTNTRGKYGSSNMVIALPLEQFRYIGDTRMESGTDTTIMQFILQNNQSNGIMRFEPVYETTGAGIGPAAGQDIAIAYPMDAQVVEAQIAEQIMWMPMQIKGKAFLFDSEMEFGGVVIRYPVAMTQRYGV